MRIFRFCERSGYHGIAKFRRILFLGIWKNWRVAESNAFQVSMKEDKRCTVDLWYMYKLPGYRTLQYMYVTVAILYLAELWKQPKEVYEVCEISNCVECRVVISRK